MKLKLLYKIVKLFGFKKSSSNSTFPLTGGTFDPVCRLAGQGGLVPEVSPRTFLVRHFLQSVVSKVALDELGAVSRVTCKSGAIGHLTAIAGI